MTHITPKYPHNILLAADGSEHSYAAAEFLTHLPLPKSTTITGVYVLIPRHAQLKKSFQNVLKPIENKLRDSNASIETKILSGYPSSILTNYAEKHCCDLTVLGAKGLRSTLGILLGGVAQQVVEYSCCPVLIVRVPYKHLKRILLVVDGSDNSRAATAYLGQFSIPSSCQLYTLHVLSPLIQDDFYIQSWPAGIDMIHPVAIPNDLQEQLQKQAQKEQVQGELLLEQTEAELASYGVNSQTSLQRGDAATKILQFIDEENIDLVITGSRGLGKIQGWFLGSVSRKLAHYANCSVLIVKDLPSSPNERRS
ncbi:MAG: universal stress protein [Chloroflexi bacterium]|nr:universal stress protein [Chloroflexota bacterium]